MGHVEVGGLVAVDLEAALMLYSIRNVPLQV